jgi:NAD(P) transhydrogenase
VTVEVDPGLLVSQLLKRKDAVRELETQRAVGNLARHGIETVYGEARLLDPHRVGVTTAEGPRELEADVVLVVTGSHPHRPLGIPYEDADVHDADGILRIDHLPGSLTVLGGGVIGCEYACMFAAMGVEVHLVDQRPALLPFLDPEMGERLAAGMTTLGVRLRPRAPARTRRANPTALACRLTSGEALDHRRRARRVRTDRQHGGP